MKPHSPARSPKPPVPGPFPPAAPRIRRRAAVVLALLGATLGQNCISLPQPEEPEHETQISNFLPLLPIEADAGPDQAAFAGAEVVLDGSASQGPPEADYLWEQLSGPPVELLDAAAPVARFLAPPVEAGLALEFQLMVSRGSRSSADTVIVQILPPPVPLDIAIYASTVQGLPPLDVAFGAYRIDGEPLPEGAFSWDFGDGTAEEGAAVSHVFPHPATYLVTLCPSLGGGFVSTGCTQQAVTVIDGSGGLTISGFIVHGDAPVPSVVVATSDGATAVTDSSGGYALIVPAYWTGVVTPQHGAYLFEPASYSYADLSAHAAGQSFAVSAASLPADHPPVGDPMISGQVLDYAGRPMAGVPLVFTGTGGSSGQSFTATSGADGLYQRGLPAGWTGTVTSNQNLRLDPPFQTYTGVAWPVAGQNFLAYRNWYVAPSGGDDAAGTFAAPLASPQAAADRTQPGDTVYLRAGTYVADGTSSSKAVLRITRSGLPDQPITYAAWAGETVILTGKNTRQDVIAISTRPSDQQPSSGEGVQHIVIEGLIAEGGNKNGISIYGPANLDPPTSHITVRRCIARKNSGGGIGTTGRMNNVVIERCEAYQNHETGIYFGRMSKNFHMGEPEHDMNAASYSTIRHCLAYKNASPTTPGNTDGIGGSHTYRCNFVDNVIFANSDDGIDIYASVEANISRNLVFNHRHEDGNRAGIKCSAGGGGRHLLTRNVSFNNGSYGLEASKPSLSLLPYYASTFYNNIAYRTGSPSISIGDDTAAGTWVLQNNIAVETSGSFDFKLWTPANTLSNYNLWGASDLAVSQSVGQDLNSLTGNPGFLDPGNNINTKFDASWTIDQKLEHIRAQVRARFALSGSSICRNAGADVGQAFNGPAPDIGAYESP